MNIPVEITQLQEFLWNIAQEATRREHAISSLISFLGDLMRGMWPAILAALFLLPLATALYHPRVPRRGLWIPAFGLFGGTPRYYTHTRPASFCGLFLKSRHRVKTRYNRRRSEPAT